MSRLLLAAMIVAALTLAAACKEEGTGSQRPSQTLRINETAPAATPTPPPALPPDTTRAEVVSVVDGDTISVLMDGEEYAVRYIGIDTPESRDPRRGEECFGQEASARNEELVGGRTVGLEKDVSETDEFGRLLRYVWLDTSEMVNATLVRDGYAESISYPPDVRHQDLFDQLEAAARDQGLGLWGTSCAETPTVLSGGEPVTGGETCDYSGTDEPVIKGNISQNTGEKIYHVPGQENYEPTRINEAAGERWFCTESDAVSAGWRKSQR